VLEVQAVAGPDLDDAAAEPEEELGAVGALAGGLGLRAQTVKRLARRLGLKAQLLQRGSRR